MKLAIQRVVLLTAVIVMGFGGQAAAAATLQDSGAVGLEGTVPAAAPTQGATITSPANGASFSSLPITVAGLCPKGLLVEVYKNGVFAGSVDCAAGSYSLQIDLFSGRNDLVAKVYDALNQQGPDSDTVSVNFNQSLPAGASQVVLLSQYAKRGAQPGDKLTWPLTISGGSPPYAISADWGDGSTADLLSRQAPGDLNIEHIYRQSGSYKVIIKATDANGSAAFLQLNGLGNGPVTQTAATTANNRVASSFPAWIFLVIGLPVFLTAFWLGTRHQLQTIRNRLEKGEAPLK